MGKGQFSCVHVIAAAQMQCTLNYLPDLRTIHAQHFHMYFRPMAISKHQTCVLANLYAVALLYRMSEVSMLLSCQQDWSNDVTDT